MGFYAECDIELKNAIENLKEDMQHILELIEICNAQQESYYYTGMLEKDIKRFLIEH